MADEDKKRRLIELKRRKLELLRRRQDPTIRSATQPFEGQTSSGQGLVSAATTLATGAASQLVSGVGGAVDLAVNRDPERAGQNIRNFQEAFTADPSPEAEQTLSTLGEQAARLNRILSIPIDALDAFATGIASGDFRKSPERFDQLREQPDLRERRALEIGPGAATVTEVGPTAAAEAAAAITGLGGVNAAVKIADRVRAATRPDIDVFDDAGRFTEEAIEELEKLQPEQIQEAVGEAQTILTPEQARRLNLFRERGVTPLAADITRRTEDSIDQQQAIKEGGTVAEIAAQQERQLEELIRQGITETGGIATDATETSASIRGAITDVSTEMESKVTEAYNAAKQAAAGEAVVDISDYIDFLKRNKGKDKVTEGGVKSALTDIRNRGLLEKDASPFVTVEDAELIRQGLNKDFDPLKPRRNTFLREAKEALDSEVEASVGSDLFAEARQANIRFKNMLKRARRDKFDQSKGSLVEDILVNKIPEEKIFDKIVSPTTRADDVEKLRDFLLSTGNKQAWDDLRAQTLRNALDKALSTKSLREGGQASFNVRLFENEMKRIRGKKFDILFNDDEKQLIQDISEIGNARIPIQGTFSGEGPTSIAVNQARDALLGRLPLVGPLAEGMVDAVRSKRREKRLTEFTEPTEEAIKRNR